MQLAVIRLNNGQSIGIYLGAAFLHSDFKIVQRIINDLIQVCVGEVSATGVDTGEIQQIIDKQ